MRILVTCKQVPDPDVRVRVLPDGTGIQTDGLAVVNPFDEIALEEALRLTEKHGGEVIVVGMGGADVAARLRACLAMGATRGILVADEEPLDSDGVSVLLAEVVKREKPDLLLLGKLAVDDEAAQVGPLTAARLGYPIAACACKIDVAAGKAVVRREVDGGVETLELSLPAVVTADLRLNEPRFASLSDIRKAKSKPIEVWTPEALGGRPVPKVRVVAWQATPSRRAGIKVRTVAELMDKLVHEAKAL